MKNKWKLEIGDAALFKYHIKLAMWNLFRSDMSEYAD